MHHGDNKGNQVIIFVAPEVEDKSLYAMKAVQPVQQPKNKKPVALSHRVVQYHMSVPIAAVEKMFK